MIRPEPTAASPVRRRRLLAQTATRAATLSSLLPLLPAMVLLMLFLAGCAAVGPNYAGPPEVAKTATDRPTFARSPLAPVGDAPPPSRWWDAVGDPVLARLVDDAFAASPTLQSAAARVRSARAQQAVNRAALGPTGGTGARYVRGRVPTGSLLGSGSSSGSSTTGGSGSSSSIPDPIRLDSYTVSADATWEIDLFGGKRRGLESATAAAEARQAALEDAQVRLAGDVGQAYAQLREAQDRLALAARTVELRSRMLSLVQQRRAGGTASQGDVERADADLAQARAELPGIATTVDQQLDQLAILSGREPGAYDTLLAVPAASWVEPPLPPETVPVGAPADWLRRRPDIRQAERTLASRNATIGQNVADLFPSVSIFGLIAGTGSHVGDLFRSAPIWLATPSLTWNFLDIPSTRAKIRGAEADRDESIAEYQRTVLEALQDANDSLSKFGRGRQALIERGAARGAAARAAQITRERYAAGTASLTDALDAERQRMQADDAWVQAAANALVAYVSLQKSLGLGWGPSPAGDPADPAAGGAMRQSERSATTVATAPFGALPDAPTPPAAAMASSEPRSMSTRATGNLGSVARTASGRSAFAGEAAIPEHPPRGIGTGGSYDDGVTRRGESSRSGSSKGSGNGGSGGTSMSGTGSGANDQSGNAGRSGSGSDGSTSDSGGTSSGMAGSRGTDASGNGGRAADGRSGAAISGSNRSSSGNSGGSRSGGSSVNGRSGDGSRGGTGSGQGSSGSGSGNNGNSGGTSSGGNSSGNGGNSGGTGTGTGSNGSGSGGSSGGGSSGGGSSGGGSGGSGSGGGGSGGGSS